MIVIESTLPSIWAFSRAALLSWTILRLLSCKDHDHHDSDDDGETFGDDINASDGDDDEKLTCL